MKAIFRLATAAHAWLYRLTKGKAGGAASDSGPILLLTTTGAKSGKKRVSPLMYVETDAGYAVCASMNGAPNNPGWYHNAKANPAVEVQVGADTLQATARIAPPQERDAIFARFKEMNPRFAGYETKTERVIPVVVIEP